MLQKAIFEEIVLKEVGVKRMERLEGKYEGKPCQEKVEHWSICF